MINALKRQVKTSPSRPRKTFASRLALELDNSIPFLIRDTHRHLVRALDEELEKRGISRGYWYFLRVLWEEEGLSQSELAARIGVMTPTTTASLSNLERAGLITRRADTKDKRKQLIFLTPSGRALEQQLIPVAHRVLANALRDVSDEEADFLRNLLGKIRKNLAIERGVD